jgi:predicted transcriptional regulator
MLTPLELDIMKAVWRRAPITVREVQQAIQPQRQLAYTTVMTVMDRLFHKGFLTRTLRSRAHHYQPAVDYAKARDEALNALIASFFGSREKLKEFLEQKVDAEAAAWDGRTPSLQNLDESLL